MQQLLTRSWVPTITAVYSSTEQKAMEGAAILAGSLVLPVQHLAALGENDRSSTGFLPPQEFEAVADLFFANPEDSIRGWEPAFMAQRRIVSAVNGLIEHDTTIGSIAIVSHGGVGTLLLCHLMGESINRAYDQPCQGNYYVFTVDSTADSAGSRDLVHGWQAIDSPHCS